MQRPRSDAQFARSVVRRTSVFALALLATAACASPPAPPPEHPRPEPIVEVEPEPEISVSSIPEACADEGETCLPPSAWVNKLCSGVYPEVALHMFKKGSPWTRLFAKARAPAFNTAGGAPSLAEENIDMHEELIALRRNTESRGGMQMGSEIAGYDVLRWNGSCVTLHDGEFSTKRPRRLTHSRIDWRWLSDPIREALQSDDRVHQAYLARRKECRGVTLGRVTKSCVKQDDALVDAIVAYVRNGGALPEPTEHP